MRHSHINFKSNFFKGFFIKGFQHLRDAFARVCPRSRAEILSLGQPFFSAAMLKKENTIHTHTQTHTHRSVVGSGPTLCPGKSLLSRERMKLVLPTLYCPTISTMGLASKSAGFIGGEWK